METGVPSACTLGLGLSPGVKSCGNRAGPRRLRRAGGTGVWARGPGPGEGVCALGVPEPSSARAAPVRDVNCQLCGQADAEQQRVLSPVVQAATPTADFLGGGWGAKMGFVIRQLKKLFLKVTRSLQTGWVICRAILISFNKGGGRGPHSKPRPPGRSGRLVGVKAAACSRVLSCRDPGSCAAVRLARPGVRFLSRFPGGPWPPLPGAAARVLSPRGFAAWALGAPAAGWCSLPVTHPRFLSLSPPPTPASRHFQGEKGEFVSFIYNLGFVTHTHVFCENRA